MHVPLALAAQQLGLPYRTAFDLVLRGRLEAQRTDRGRWFVSRESLDRLLAARAQQGVPTAKVGG